jgi:hypothetical protein
MKSYTVTRAVDYGTNAKDQRRYQPGEPIELEDKDADPLLKAGAIEPGDSMEQRSMIGEAIEGAAVLVASGAMNIEQALDQIKAQMNGVVRSQLRRDILSRVEELNDRAKHQAEQKAAQEAEAARQEQEAAAAREQAAAKTDKKKK